jgi:cytidylate kinase
MRTEKKITIAIDGYSSCGKSTLAKALAKELAYIFIDTGAMYRGVALYCMQHKLINEGIPNIPLIVNSLKDINLRFQMNPKTLFPELILNNENVEQQIRTLEVSSTVSKIASIKEVREKLVHEQRKMGAKGGIVMDGRDIGSVVFPHAELKLFVTAKPEIRANRRYLELSNKGDEVTLEAISENLEERDYLDSTREESPLVQTSDAVVLDNSELNQEEQLKIALDLAQEKISTKH